MQGDVSSIYEEEAFRDSISTVDKDGKRIWLYPKKPKGRYYNARTWVSLAFIVVFLVLPFIKVNGYQILQFDILNRQFVLFGALFTPHDFHILGLLMVTGLVFITLFTVVFGRLFCGWVCPQTVFMEMIFRKIEYWIEGDWKAQQRLNKAPWDTEKIQKKTIKHLIFFAIAFVVANYFLAYIIGMDEVIKIIKEPIAMHIGGFLAILFFSFIFYAVFARLREQVCTTICPYGRLQSVLLVPDSVVVGYDYKRGEPRGRLKKKKAVEKVAVLDQGDCIDCKLCVAVCPTGIDIRNGTQLECTNCTACIDACDEVMDKVGYERGLIRYDSMTGIEKGERKIFTPRVIAYSVALLLLLVADGFMLANRGSMEAIILRAKGQTYQKVDEAHISNLYTYSLINKMPTALPIHVELDEANGELKFAGVQPDTLPKAGKIQGAFTVTMPRADLHGFKNDIKIKIYSGDELIETVHTNFMGPKN